MVGQQLTERALKDYKKGWNSFFLGFRTWSVSPWLRLVSFQRAPYDTVSSRDPHDLLSNRKSTYSMIIIVKLWYWKFKDWLVRFEARCIAEMALLGSNITSEVRIYLVRLFRCMFFSLFSARVCNAIYIFWKFWVE